MSITLRIVLGLFVVLCMAMGRTLAMYSRLKNEVTDKDKQIRSLKGDLKTYESQIEAIMNVNNSIPEGCMQGPYCEACTFVKHYSVPAGHGEYIRLSLCGKGVSCDCFIEKGETK